MGDSRAHFIAQASSLLCGRAESAAQVAEDPQLLGFLDDQSCDVLRVAALRDGSFSLARGAEGAAAAAAEGDSAGFSVFFVKVARGPVTEANLHEALLVTTQQQSALASLHHTVSKIFAPALDAPDSQRSLGSGARGVQSLLTSLDARLSAARAEAGDDQSGEDRTTDVEGELRFWRAKKRAREPGADEVMDLLGPLLEALAAPRSASVDEVVEAVADAPLPDLLGLGRDAPQRPPYPPARFPHLAHLISAAVVHMAQASVGASGVDIWRDAALPGGEPLDPLLAALVDACRGWRAAVAQVAQAPGWEQHQRQPGREGGDALDDPLLGGVQRRLSDILDMRRLHAATLRLLGEEEQETLARRDPFAPFRPLSPLAYSAASEAHWRAAVDAFHKAMAPTQNRIIDRLRARATQSASGAARPQQQLRLFLRHTTVATQPAVLEATRSEREALLSDLSAFIDQLEGDFEVGIEAAAPTQGESDAGGRRDRLTRAGAISRARQLRVRARGLESDARVVLGDLEAFGAFADKARALGTRCEDTEQQLFRDWRRAVEEGMREGELSLTSTRVMEIDDEGLVVVNFSDRLVALLRDVRQLGELGFSIPSRIRTAAEEAERSYQSAVMLKKVADFYNALDREILPSQRQLMLRDLAEFEKRLTRGRGQAATTWGDAEQCRIFVDELQEAANRVKRRNDDLRALHASVRRGVLDLMDVDLLRQREKWKKAWQSVRETVAREPASAGAQPWLQHWDRQVYKAVEVSYRMGLESLNEKLPRIECELVFQDRVLGLSPPLEELRATYYKEVRKFAAFPSRFPGLGAEPALYARMPAANRRFLRRVYENAEALFARVEALVRSMRPWVVLGRVGDLDAFVEQHVATVADFTANFSALTKKGKELRKLPDTFRIDCVTVSAAPLKAAAEEQARRLSGALLFILVKALRRDMDDTSALIAEGEEKLNPERADSAERIAEAQREWQALSGRVPEVEATLAECDRKLDVLREHHGGRNSRVDADSVREELRQLRDTWGDFRDSLDAFHDTLQNRREEVKQRLDSDLEALGKEIEAFADLWRTFQASGIESFTDEQVAARTEELKSRRAALDDLTQRAATLHEHCEQFGKQDARRFPELAELEQEVAAVEASWGQYSQFVEELGAMAEQDWITFRKQLYDLQDFATQWMGKLKTQSRADPVVGHLKDRVQELQQALPGLAYCKGDVPFTDVHWKQLFKRLGIPRDTRLDTLKLRHFLDVLPRVVENTKWCKELTARATGEIRIREAIVELTDWADSAELTMVEHECLGRTSYIVSGWKELFSELGDNQSLLASLKDSPYFRAFSDQADQFESRFAAVDEYGHWLSQIQRKWLYLEPIFGRGALPSEQARFRRVDEEFVDITSKLASDPHVFTLCDPAIFPGLKDTLTMMLDQLERCQKALADFLEEKRSKMPRFYFLGDDDLLEVLGQAQNPAVIQLHLKKLFQGVHRVEFDDNATHIVAMCSAAGEVVRLDNPVPVTDRVEEWLTAFAGEMKSTMAALLGQCVREGRDMRRFPAQVLSVAEQVRFTEEVEAALRGGSLAGVGDNLRTTMRDLTEADYAEEPLLQLKVKALVLDLLHMVDVLEQLQRASRPSPSSWAWQKQLRFYLTADGDCEARMADASFAYTHEYQGNAPRLVHTPLTDKCYLTLTQGMHQGFGGNPYGPAGTGKTESVKALGQAMGRQVLVFNCDEGIDFQSMGRIFIGLVKCGAWGCFDEFNRLKEDQLSAVSQQIQVIQNAIKERHPSLKLLGRQVEVDHNAGIFVTMNPAGKGYGGRSKLPDNLKALFRPVAMSRPNNDLIAEAILHSEGFAEARELGRKMVSLFTLSRQLLSPQQHYDWGLRAMKAVLVTGGRLIGDARKAGDAVTPELEREMLIKAVRVNTLSKLTFSDSQRFLALIGDVFPGTESQDIAYEELTAAIRETLASGEFGLEFDDRQVRKMLQLKEALDQRMGCVIVGPSGCGKSTLWRVLKAALVRTGQAVVTHVMNPKSMPRQRLLGHMDLDTREWTDGVLTAAARQVVKEPASTRSWIVCDGDVDPEWIESLNSVLDDNHLLTLPNGERISFGPNVNFLFETHDLRFASPATVSRMGMIFLSDEDVDVGRLLRKWVAQQPEEARLSLASWVEDYFQRALDWVLARGTFVVDTTMVGTVKNGLSHIHGAATREQFLVGLVRGLGGNLPEADRAELAKEVFRWAGEHLPEPARPLDTYCDPSGALRAFAAPSVDESLTRGDVHRGAVIETVSVQRGVGMVQRWVESMEPFVLVGPEGCGKTMLVLHALAHQRGTTLSTLHCNAQTTAEHVIRRIQQSCVLYSSTHGRVYRPREGERLVLFLKDINLPRPDQYDTCMLVAFLQQLLTFHGFYDANLEFLGLERVHIVCSMNPATTVGRHPLSTRFTAIVRVAAIDYPDAHELGSVYAAYLGAVLRGARLPDPKWLRASNVQRLAGTMVELYAQLRAKFSVDDHRHYLFTPRDLTAWVKGVLRYDLESEALLDVVAHEAQRRFRDRLVGGEAEHKFDSMLGSVLRAQWKHAADLRNSFFTAFPEAQAEAVAAHQQQGGGEAKDGGGGGEAKGGGGGGEEEGEDGSALGHGDRGGALLVRVGSDDFESIVKRGMTMYAREEKELDISLFPEVLEHVARVDRVLSGAGGSLLLVGRSGVGRRTATALAAHMHGMAFSSPHVTRDFGAKRFGASLKEVMQRAGVEGEQVVLYVEDHQFTEDSILEMVNSVLSSGEVPGLYTHEELEPLLAPLKELVGQDGFGRFRTPHDLFLSRIQGNLHVVVGMDPTHLRFAARCESNPALFARCEVLWFGSWRRSSLLQLPPLLLPDLMAQLPDPEALVPVMADIHASCTEESKEEGGGAAEMRPAAPLDYVVFLRNFADLYRSKYTAVEGDAKRMQAGLSKLQEASTTVDELSREAEQQRGDLKQKQHAADTAMTKITEALEEASRRRADVEKLQGELAEAEKETMGRKSQIEEELSTINPVLESAREAVGQIQSAHLTEIRSLSMPPEPIHDVLSAVLMLLNINDTSWLSMRKFLGSRGVKEDILSYDARRITPEIRKNVSRLLKKKSDSFDQANIQRVSAAAAPLAAWVKANVRYSLVLQKIEPLEQDLAAATEALRKSQEQLAENERELGEIDDRVKRMKDEFAARTREAETLRQHLERTEVTLEKAEALLGKLGGEQGRWERQVGELHARLEALPVRVLLAAGFATYLVPYPEDVRRDLVSRWSQAAALEGGERFDLLQLLSSESELLSWKSEGLPSDELTMENALVLLHTTRRAPLLIDPATRATAWLEAHLTREKSRTVEVITTREQRFQNQVELAVRFGKTLIVKEVDAVDPMLYPLLRRDFTQQGPRLVVQIGDKAVDFHENFQLFLVTRNPELEVPPDAASMVTRVNFAVTRSGLEGQLLGATIQHERPELEAQKSQMLQQEEEFKVQLASLEAKLLDSLASSEGSLLENQTLVDSLTQAKAKSAEIAEALEESAEASAKLDTQREVYLPFAGDGSRLFFLMKALQNEEHMYQFSLASFLEIFRKTLGADMYHQDTEDRIRQLTPMLERRLLDHVARALFKADRLMWAMHVVHGMHADQFGENEWELFVGDLVPDLEAGRARDFPDWAPPDRAPYFALLRSTLPRVVSSLRLQDAQLWSRWSRSPNCESEFPAEVERALTAFQRLLVVQVLRPDRLQSAMQAFVCGALGVKTTSPPAPTFEQLYKTETEAAVPVLMITTTGADPSKELFEYAVSEVGEEHYAEMAMGGGTQDQAVTLMRDAARRGDWLCLKNLHLVTAWLPTLEKELNALQPHKRFRLWLTTESHPNFPPILLQQSLKITFESPPGIKNNLQRTYDSWAHDFVARGNVQRAHALFLLAYLHAILQERRTYVPQGWTEFYEFSFGDLRAAANVLDAALERGARRGGPSWPTVYGLFMNAIYGGRVANTYDTRVLAQYLYRYFNDDALHSRGANCLPGRRELPDAADKNAYLNFIASLPDVDSPADFGLPADIDRSLQRVTSSRVIDSLKTLERAAAAAAKFDRSMWQAKLRPVMDVWAKLTHASREALGESKVEDRPDVEPLEQFVVMEYRFACRLVRQVHQDLSAVQRVAQGTDLLTPAIQTTATALLGNTVPAAWQELWEGPERPQGWLRAVVARKVALARWVGAAQQGSLLGEGLDLGELFSPNTFLNALRQQTARKARLSMDKLVLASSWSSRSLPNASLSVRLEGLWLQGATFAGASLSDAQPDANDLEPAPPVTIGFVPEGDAPQESPDSLAVPVYLTTSREKVFTELSMPCTGKPAKWIIAGVALFLSDET